MERFGYAVGDKLGDLYCTRCGLHLGWEIYRGTEEPPPDSLRLPTTWVETHLEVEGAKRVRAKELPPSRPGFTPNATATEWRCPAHIGPDVEVQSHPNFPKP